MPISKVQTFFVPTSRGRRSRVKLGVIGVGLIGGSIAARARVIGWEVLEYDPGLVDGTSFEAVVAEAETIVVAAPPQATVEILARLADAPPKASLIVDVASVKQPAAIAAINLSAFVGTHPMAGKEQGGREHAEANLFEGRPWMYVPSGDNALDTQAIDFIVAMGGIVSAVDASEHDRAVARTSHLPQMIAYVVAERIATLTPELQASASGPVARELLRLAKSEHAMWDEIYAENRDNVVEEARALAQRLNEIADAL